MRPLLVIRGLCGFANWLQVISKLTTAAIKVRLLPSWRHGQFVGYADQVAVWLLAIGLALIAGFAVARGGICAVAGVRQLIETRQAHIFLSFLECSAWALLALILANAVGLMSIGGWPSRMLVAGALIGAPFLDSAPSSMALVLLGRLHASGPVIFRFLPWSLAFWLAYGACILPACLERRQPRRPHTLLALHWRPRSSRLGFLCCGGS